MRKFTLSLAASFGMLLAAGTAAQASTIVSGVWHLDASAGPAAYAHNLEDFESYNGNGLGTTPSGTLHGTGAYAGSSISTTGAVKVVNGDVAKQHVFPHTVDNTNYLSVFGAGQEGGSHTPGLATITLSAAAHYIGFLWGSVDDYNTISFLDKLGNTLASFTGNDFTFPGKIDHTSAEYANFTTSAEIWKIVLGSSHQNSFELDNITVAAVPLPAALPLFGAALAGMGVLGRKRRNAKAAA